MAEDDREEGRHHGGDSDVASIPVARLCRTWELEMFLWVPLLACHLSRFHYTTLEIASKAKSAEITVPSPRRSGVLFYPFLFFLCASETFETFRHAPPPKKIVQNRVQVIRNRSQPYTSVVFQTKDEMYIMKKHH